MPKIIELLGGYIATIWSNENGEPIHVHMCRKRASEASTKIWILRNGGVLVANNGAGLSSKELRRTQEILVGNWDFVVTSWYQYHGYIKFFM